MRRSLVAAGFLCAVAACAPSSPAPGDTTAATATAMAPTAAVSIDPVQLGGMWSFGRDCARSDLVITNHSATYYDYADAANAVAYDGPWAIDGSRVIFTLHRLDAHGAPVGEAVTYDLDIAAPVTADLSGSFGLSGGASRDINAKQCANEVHE